MDIFENLGPRASLDACVKCTICETHCPVAKATPLFPGPKYVGPQAERFRAEDCVDDSIDYCSSCGTCTLVCPQGVKVAEINAHARTEMKRRHGIPLRDRLISRTTTMGKLMTPFAPIANWALNRKGIRVVIEKTIGVHRSAPMPPAKSRTFESWFRRHAPNQNAGKKGQLIFFHGCAGQYFEVETSIQSVQVLEHLGYEVLVPPHGCCGLAMQSNGLYDQARKQIDTLTKQLRAARQDVPIVTASGSCGGMLRHEAAEILGVDTPELTDVSARTRDICEFLLDLHDRGELDEDFERVEMRVPYHAPCQLRSIGMGTPAAELMRLIPGVDVVESDQPCCGIAGTYGLKKEKYDIAQRVGQGVFDMIADVNPELATCDTETCRWQLRASTGAEVVHPIQLLHRAYGLA